MIVVLHRERSEKLARRFADIVSEMGETFGGWADWPQEEREMVIGVFDALIQEGLISER